jgi:hypothetical protein
MAEMLYAEGLATHGGSESCARGREAAGEALTGVCAGSVLSRESCNSGVPTPLGRAEGNTKGIDKKGEMSRAPRGRRPDACT